MRILFIHSDNKNSQFYNDYMSDLLLHGFREIYGKDVIDYPGCWYLYKDEILKRKYDEHKFWGKGFTIKNILNEFNSIDREDILKKIQKRYFNLIIFGSIRRSDQFIEEVVKYKNNFIFIDGEDDNYIENKYANLGLYFKRELIKKTSKILPISFAIPKSKIISEIDKNPKDLLAPLIPGKLDTYIYENENSYYEMYQKSIFALTYKKAGWDCLRHYEIMMNGCIPLFLNIKNCPVNTMTTIPKEKLVDYNEKFHKILSFYNPFKIFKKKHLTFQRILLPLLKMSKKNKLDSFLEENNNDIIFELKSDLLNFTRKNLTTEIVAKKVLENFKTD